MNQLQAGSEAFNSGEGKSLIDAKQAKKSAKQVLADRTKGDSQGLFGFLKTVDKQFTVTYNENLGQSFKAYLLQDLTAASAKCNVQTDERCIEGPIPVECTSAACGTCWVGVVAGKDNLSAVTPLESKAIKTFGYKAGDDSKPSIRLACQAKAEGAVTIAIPSWNGVFGKKVYGVVVDVDMTPATTSAKKLRETIAEAAGK
jgi:ferredoxin